MSFDLVHRFLRPNSTISIWHDTISWIELPDEDLLWRLTRHGSTCPACFWC